MAPSDMRLPVTPSRTMPMTAMPIASGMASAAISAPRKLPERQEQHDDDQQRALGQVDGDGLAACGR